MSEESTIDATEQITLDNEKSLQFVQAEDLRKKKQLPKFPAWQITLDDLQKWLDLLTTDQLPRVLMYLYRTMPIIVRQQVDPDADTNIDKVSGVDENGLKHWKLDDIRNGWIKPTHGGGGYRLDICDTANPNKKFKGSKLGECRFVIPDSEAEPIINLHELDRGKKENKAYVNKLVAQGKLDKDGNVIETKPNGQAVDPIALMKETVSLAEKMSASQQAVLRKELGVNDASGKALGEVLTEMVKQNDPKKQMDQVLNIVNALTTSMKANTANVVSAPDNTTAILKLMMDQNQQNMTLFMKMMDMQIAAITANKPTQSNPGSTDPTELMEKTMAMVDRMMQWREGRTDTVSEDEPKDWKDKLLDIGEKIATPLALSWLQKQYATPGAPVPGMQTGNVPQSQFSPPSSALPKAQPNQTHVSVGKPYSPYSPGAQAPAQQIQQIPEHVMQPEVIQQADTATVQQPQPPGAEVLQAIAAYGPMIAEKMVAGVKGYDFGEWVKNGFGITPIMLVKKYPAEQIVALVKQHIPQFYQAVQHLGDEYVINWIDEFGKTEEILDRLDREDEVEDSPL